MIKCIAPAINGAIAPEVVRLINAIPIPIPLPTSPTTPTSAEGWISVCWVYFFGRGIIYLGEA